jgi:hypothetical protein
MGEDLKKAVQEALEKMYIQTMTENLGVGKNTAIRLKKGLPADVDFFKAISFIELTLENNGLFITNKID